jgi:Undecaprenyl-phosphate galactose phosphotransferase WbaP
VTDIFSLISSILGGWIIASFLGFAGAASAPPIIIFSLILGLTGLFMILGLYSGMGMNPIYEFRQCITGICLLFVFIAATLISTGKGYFVLFTFPVVLLVLPIMRSAVRGMLSTTNWWGVRCVVFDCHRRVNSLFSGHLKNAPSGLRPIGFVQDELPSSLDDELRPYYLGSVENSGEAARLMNGHETFVALVHRCGRPDNKIADVVKTYLPDFSRVIIVPDDERLPSLWAMGQNGGIMIEDKLLQPGAQITKRIADVLISGTALTLGMPLLLFLAAWVKITSPGPLFFGHERIGRNGRRFKAWKFRSMCVNADEVLEKTLAENPAMREEWEATQKLQNDPRVSSSGRFLRKTSLDELPQLWNVFVGEMSLVGPRPIVTNEVEKYEDKFETYLRVTPGITGYWQVSGRNLTTYDKRVELDDYYVRNWSLWFDFYILGRTVKTVLFREGAF